MFSYRFISLPRPRSSRTPEQQQTSAKGDFINLPIEWMAFSWHFSFVIIIIIFVLVCFVLPFLVLATYRFEDLANENKYPFVVCLLFAHETNQKQEVIKKSKLNWIAKTIYLVTHGTRAQIRAPFAQSRFEDSHDFLYFARAIKSTTTCFEYTYVLMLSGMESSTKYEFDELQM